MAYPKRPSGFGVEEVIVKLSIHVEHERTALILTALVLTQPLCRLAQLGYISLIICVGTKKAKVNHNKLNELIKHEGY